MKHTINFYEILPKYHYAYVAEFDEEVPVSVFGGTATKLFDLELDLNENDSLYDAITKEVPCNDNFAKYLDSCWTYYWICDEGTEDERYGVIALHKGYAFVDVAEHEDRTIMSAAFPDNTKLYNSVEHFD